MPDGIDLGAISAAQILDFLQNGESAGIAKSTDLPDDILAVADEIGSVLYFAGHESTENNPLPPTQINYFEIDLMQGNNLDVRVRRSARQDVSGWTGAGSNPVSVEQALTDALSRGFPPPVENNPMPNPHTGHRKNPITQLALLPPISNGSVSAFKCLYVFKIEQNGNSGNVRFSTRHAPFSLVDTSIEVGQNLILTKRVISLASLIAEGSEGERRQGSTELLVKSFKGDNGQYPESLWACIMLDWEPIIDASHEDIPTFAVKFNIHVEVKDRKTDNYVPIIIDPDIGHPGGNNTGP